MVEKALSPAVIVGTALTSILVSAGAVILFRGAGFITVGALCIFALPILLRTAQWRGAIVMIALISVLLGPAAVILLDSASALAVIVTYVAILTVLPRKARRHGAVVARTAATFVVALVVVAALFLHSFPRWIVRDTDMKRWIAAELPRGSSETAVRAFLHRHSVPGETVDHFTDNQGVVIYAEVEPNFSDLVCGGDLRMTFYLGRSDRLNNHDVEERLVCL